MLIGRVGYIMLIRAHNLSEILNIVKNNESLTKTQLSDLFLYQTYHDDRLLNLSEWINNYDRNDEYKA